MVAKRTLEMGGLRQGNLRVSTTAVGSGSCGGSEYAIGSLKRRPGDAGVRRRRRRGAPGMGPGRARWFSYPSGVLSSVVL